MAEILVARDGRRRGQRRHVEEHGCRHRCVVVDVAVVRDRASGAHAAGELPTLAESPIESEIHAVIDLCLTAVIRRLRDEIVNPSEKSGLDVVQAANLIAAATRQAAVFRRRDAVRVVAGRGNGLVIGREVPAVPRAEIADVQRQTLRQLVLERDRRLPVVELLVEAGQRIGSVARRQPRPPEVLIRPRAALPVGRRVQLIAIGNEVAGSRIANAERRVVPRPVRGEREQIRRVRRRDTDDVRVAAERPFQRGLAVAKEIVGAAETRAEIPPMRDVLRGGNPSLRHEEPGGRDERRARHVDVVVAQSQIHRETAKRPLILRVDRGIERGLLEVRRRGEQLQ